jgi:hypothetical protein
MDGVTLLRRARQAGLAVAAENGKLVIKGPRRAEQTALLLLAHKPEVMIALAADWHARWREALGYWSAFHPADEAAQLAWGELEIRWHRLHRARAPEWQCCGCGEPIGALAALDLADGNRVHLDKLDCLFSFGERWRNEAATGLRALGLDPPADLVELL